MLKHEEIKLGGADIFNKAVLCFGQKLWMLAGKRKHAVDAA